MASYFTRREAESLVRRLRANRLTARECWLWTGATFNNGRHGAISVGQRVIPVHRAAYKLFVGPLGRNRIVRQVCAHSLCFQPGHLWRAGRSYPSKQANVNTSAMNIDLDQAHARTAGKGKS